MARFWVSWWSGNYEDEGCTKPPFDSWCSGVRARADTKRTGRDEESYYAVIDTENKGAEKRIMASIKKHFPDAEMRFIEPKPLDFKPGSRFPGFDEKQTALQANA
jgi:hypothetical protein